VTNVILEDADPAEVSAGGRVVGDDQRKGLKVSGDVDLTAVVIATQNFAEVDGPALWRDCPKNVSEILTTERRGLLQIAKFNFDFCVTFLAFHFCLAIRCRHQFRPGKIQLGGPTPVLVIDRLGAAAGYRHVKNGSRAYGFDQEFCLRSDLSKSAHAEKQGGC